MQDTIRERVIQTIARARKISPDQISLDTTFEELGMDSLDALSVIYDLEEEFNVAIANEEVIRLRNVRQAVESLERLITGQEALESDAAPMG